MISCHWRSLKIFKRFSRVDTPALWMSSKEPLASAGHTVTGVTYYCLFAKYFSFISGLEHHIPLMADICPPLVGVPHLDHPICTMVLYGLLSRTGDLCWATPPCTVRLWPSAYWRWITTTRPHGNIWLFRAGTEEMAISLFTLGCTGTPNSYNVLK